MRGTICQICEHNEACALFPDQDGHCRQFTLKPYLNDPWLQLYEAFSQAFASAAEIVAAMAKNLKTALWSISKSSENMEMFQALAWATAHHPEWVKILDRTKRRRISKKYTDRILRAYRESNEKT